MTCLLPILLVLMPSANPADPVILPASPALKAAISQSHPALLVVKEAWLDGGAHKLCQKVSKTMCATKVIVDATNPSRVKYLCTETTTASVEGD